MAVWAIDYDTICDLRTQGVHFVGVLNMTTNEIYLTTRERFQDPAKTTMLNYESRGGALQCYMKFSEFSVFRRSFGKGR